MDSVIDICNIGLSHIRARSINSLEESSTEAQQCALHFDGLRDSVLRAVDWQFAKKAVALTLKFEQPLEWRYAYQYPTDCLKLRRVVGDYFFKDQTAYGLRNRFAYANDSLRPDVEAPFELENIGGEKVIVTDEPEAYGIYTKKISDPAIFDPLFTQALAWLVAATLAIPVIGGDYGRKVREDSLGMYRSMLDSAIVAEQSERKRPGRRPARLVEVRR